MDGRVLIIRPKLGMVLAFSNGGYAESTRFLCSSCFFALCSRRRSPPEDCRTHGKNTKKNTGEYIRTGGTAIEIQYRGTPRQRQKKQCAQGLLTAEHTCAGASFPVAYPGELILRKAWESWECRNHIPLHLPWRWEIRRTACRGIPLLPEKAKCLLDCRHPE